MTISMMQLRRPVLIAPILALFVLGSVFSQGGGSGAGSGSPSKPEPGASKPADTEEDGSGKTSRETGRSGSAGRVASGSSIGAPSLDEEFNSWLATSREGARLGSVYERLQMSATPALAAGVPLDAFKARIGEAAAKGTAPNIVAAAIDADTRRWIWLANLVRSSSWPPAKSAAGFYLSAASALRNGLSQAAVRDLVVWAANSRTAPERAGAALTAAVSLAATLETRDGQVDPVARLLAASKLKIGQYDSVTTLARRSLAAGISAERFIATLEATLGKGLNLTDLEKALFP